MAKAKGNVFTTEEQKEFFKKNYYGRMDKEMSDLMQEEFGIYFSPEYLKGWRNRHNMPNGRTGRFEKGVPSPMKGKRYAFTSKEAEERCASKRFQPGQQPKNTCPVGTRRLLADGYIWYKFNDKLKPRVKRENWCQEHIWIWEQANGPVPDGYVVMHINQIKTDNRLENLICVKKQVVSYMCKQGLWSTDPEILAANILLAEVSAKIYERQGKSYKRKPKAEHKKTGPKKGKENA